MNWDQLIEAMRCQGWLVIEAQGQVWVDTWEREEISFFHTEQGLRNANHFYQQNQQEIVA